MLLGMIHSAAKIYPKTKYAIHLDHGIESHVFDAIDSGSYNSVMIDASHDDFKQNVKDKTVVKKQKLKIFLLKQNWEF